MYSGFGVLVSCAWGFLAVRSFQAFKRSDYEGGVMLGVIALLLAMLSGVLCALKVG